MKLNYRPEIDGLRAIAVLSVLIYHAQISIFGHRVFSGGFLGVDIFFVISGYLITSIIIKEILITRKFSFSHFYERRVRRIIPVLLIVIFFSNLMGWFILQPKEFVDLSKSALYSIFFISNFYFHFSGLEYGGVDSLFKPLLHIWSLAVEEQFYLIFPILLIIINKYFKRFFLVLLIYFLLISILIAEINSTDNPSLTFYSLHTRVWEILFGSIVAYLHIKEKKVNRNKILSYLAPAFGIILIIFSLIFFDDKIRHPSFVTLLPIIGTLLIIWFSKENKNEIFTRILSSKIFVGIGLISYSLYLWHYPLYVYARFTNILDGSILKKLIFGFFIIFLSIISYIFIEKPFRNKNLSQKKLIIILTSFLIPILLFSIFIIQSDGAKNRLMNLNLNDYQIDHEKKEIKNISKNNKIKFVLLGDSTVRDLSNYIKEEYSNEIELIDFTSNGCIFIKDFYLERLEFNNKYKTDPGCNLQKNKQILNFIEKNSNFFLIYGGLMQISLSGKLFENKDLNLPSRPFDGRRFVSLDKTKNVKLEIINTLNYLANYSDKLYLIYPVPELGFSPNLIRGIKILKETNNLTIPKSLYKERIQEVEDIYNKLDSLKIKKIKLEEIFCTFENRCISTNKNNSLYTDENHLSKHGLRLIFNKIIDDLNN